MKLFLRKKRFFYAEDEIEFDTKMIVKLRMIKKFIIIFYSLLDANVCQITTIGIKADKLNIKPKKIPSIVNRNFTDLYEEL
jgi:hypothetical protein